MNTVGFETPKDALASQLMDLILALVRISGWDARMDASGQERSLVEVARDYINECTLGARATTSASLSLGEVPEAAAVPEATMDEPIPRDSATGDHGRYGAAVSAEPEQHVSARVSPKADECHIAPRFTRGARAHR